MLTGKQKKRTWENILPNPFLLDSFYCRYATQKKLHVALPKGIFCENLSICLFKHQYYNPLHYNVFANHIIYNKEAFNMLMPHNTTYLTSLRETLSHARSSVHHFNVSHQHTCGVVVLSYLAQSWDHSQAFYLLHLHCYCHLYFIQ